MRFIFALTSLAVSVALLSAAACSDDDSGLELTTTSNTSSGSSSSSSSSGTGGVGPSTVVYRPDIQSDLDALGCSAASCHGGGSFPMTVAATPSSDEAWLANYQQVKARAGSPSSSKLIDKALGADGHTAVLEEGNEILDRWRTWIAEGAYYGAADGGEGGSGGTGSVTCVEDGGGGAGGVTGPPLTWDDDIKLLIVANACHGCHGDMNVQSAYSLLTYAAAAGFGSDDIPNIVPGDPTSNLIVHAEAGHNNMSSTGACLIRKWIVDWDAAED